MKRLRVGSRGSKLALAQVEILRKLLPQIEPVIIRTHGDEGLREEPGAFVSRIEQALLDGQIDVALHCLKDLPTRPVPGLELVAYLEREDPFDVLIASSGLGEPRVIGTGSARRAAQLRRLFPDAEFRPLLGNVDTRLRKLREGDYDAIVLACAGLARLGLTIGALAQMGLDARVFRLEEVVPAPGQGTLVLQTRSGDDWAQAQVGPLNHLPTAVCSAAERAFLGAFEAGCNSAVAALATWQAGLPLSFHGVVLSSDGSRAVRCHATNEILDEPVQAAQRVGLAMATEALANGAAELLR